MRYSKRSSLKIAAVILGVIAAGAPALFFNAWLRNQGEDEGAVTATWALGYAEARIGQAVTAVKELTAKSAEACKPALGLIRLKQH